MSGVLPGGTASSFLNVSDIDLSTSAGMQKLLSVVRRTPMVHDDYNELRDLIFLYKQTSGSQESAEKIYTLLRDVGILNKAAEVTEEKKEPVQTVVTDDSLEPVDSQMVEKKKIGGVSRLGTTRLKPSFAKAKSDNNEFKEIKKLEVKSDVSPEPAAESVVPKPEVTEVPAELVPKTDEVAKEKVSIKETPSPAEPEVVVEKEVVEDVKTPKESVLEVSYADPLERIKAIKQAVNKQIGNPINLIDADNNVGREYMNALLAAMKTLNSGSSGEVDKAMARLEASFVSVQETINKKKIAPIGKQSVDLSETTVKSETSAESKESSVESNATGNQVGMVVSDPAESEAVVDDYLEHSNTSDDSRSETRATDNLVSPFVPKEPLAEEVVVPDIPVAPVTNTSVPTPGLPKTDLFTGVRPAEPAAEVAATPVSQPVAAPLQSVAKEKQLENIMHANLQQEAESAKEKREAEIAGMDPFMTPDVTSGLQQLLSEWTLFKSSGLFGTGPSGIEHPMYKQLANLQMTAVIAGRFEGATPEVRQSITDYMNGWRYEEGIIHQHGETFEHYLRRVIKHILDIQKKAGSDE